MFKLWVECKSAWMILYGKQKVENTKERIETKSCKIKKNDRRQIILCKTLQIKFKTGQNISNQLNKY